VRERGGREDSERPVNISLIFSRKHLNGEIYERTFSRSGARLCRPLGRVQPLYHSAIPQIYLAAGPARGRGRESQVGGKRRLYVRRFARDSKHIFIRARHRAAVGSPLRIFDRALIPCARALRIREGNRHAYLSCFMEQTNPTSASINYNEPRRGGVSPRPNAVLALAFGFY